MQSAPRRMRSSAKRPLPASTRCVVAEAEHGGLLRALEVDEHRAVAGVLGEDVLQLADLGVGERVELHLDAHGRAAVER